MISRTLGQTQPLTPESFSRDGFGVVDEALGPDLLDALRQYTEGLLAEQEREHFESFRFHGSMLQLDPFAESLVCNLVANPRIRKALRGLGFTSPKWLSGYLISKPPKSPSLWWHQDWWAWDSPVSSAPWPAQMFVMYYLNDVDETNGALRVIPGSHQRRHSLHDRLPPAHSEEINEAPESGLAHARQPDERTVSVRAGDAVIGDCRLLHCTHANESKQRRTCLTLWYLPSYESLPEEIKSYVVDHPAQPPRGWWDDSALTPPAQLRELLPTYEGTAEPADYNRTPPPGWPNSQGRRRSAGRSSGR